MVQPVRLAVAHRKLSREAPYESVRVEEHQAGRCWFYLSTIRDDPNSGSYWKRRSREPGVLAAQASSDTI